MAIFGAGAKAANVAFQRPDHVCSEELAGGQVGIPLSDGLQNHLSHNTTTYENSPYVRVKLSRHQLQAVENVTHEKWSKS